MHGQVFFGCYSCNKWTIVVADTVTVREQGLSTVCSRQVLRLIKKAGMESLCECTCGYVSLVSLSDDSIGQIKHSTAFVWLSKPSTTQKMNLFNTFLAATLVLRVRKCIPYLSAGVLSCLHVLEQAQNQIWCPLFSYTSLNAMQNMEINQEACNSVWKDCWLLINPKSVFSGCCRYA